MIPLLTALRVSNGVVLGKIRVWSLQERIKELLKKFSALADFQGFEGNFGKTLTAWFLPRIKISVLAVRDFTNG